MRHGRGLALFAVAAALGSGVLVGASQPQPDPSLARPIAAPAHPLPPEAASARVRRFSFIVYGDTRCENSRIPRLLPVRDGREIQQRHARLVDRMVTEVSRRARSRYPVRLAVQTGDAVMDGGTAQQWNVSYVPVVDRLTREGDVPYYFAVGNHDVSYGALGTPSRMAGLRNSLSALTRFLPQDPSPRRLQGYPTYAIGYGNAFFLFLDSQVPDDARQFAWVQAQLTSLDRRRFTNVFAVFHHPPFSSGRHGGRTLEPAPRVFRERYLPLFRAHRVRMTLTGHEHLLEHWVERYEADGRSTRMDHLVTGGGGAPTDVYTAEPDLTDYLAANRPKRVTLEHLARPGRTVAENPDHFVVVTVDDDEVSIEAIAPDVPMFGPYGAGRVRLEDATR